MEKKIRIFQTPYLLAENMAQLFAGLVRDESDRKASFSVALSGGSTPELLYSVLGDHYSASIPWKDVNIFWGDERCVPPDDRESNFGMTYRALLRKINIPENNIHRIRGEEDPQRESQRYASEMRETIPERGGLPVFDLFILGLGEDGHTASIFPGETGPVFPEKICETVINPYTGQKRITLTGQVINNAARVIFLVTGKKKAAVLRDIIKQLPACQTYPAAFIVPAAGELNWFVDEEAASLL